MVNLKGMSFWEIVTAIPTGIGCICVVFLLLRGSTFEDFEKPLPDQASHQALLNIIDHDAPQSLNRFWVEVQDADVWDHLAYGKDRHVECAFNIGSSSDDIEETLAAYGHQNPYFLVEAARNSKGAWMLYTDDVNPKAMGIKDVKGWLDKCFQQKALEQQQLKQGYWGFPGAGATR